MMPALMRAPTPANDTQRRLIPFDQSFEFELGGAGGQGSQKQTVAVSVEGGFTATSIGYGFVAEAQSVEFGPNPADMVKLARAPVLDNLSLGAILDAADRALASRADFGRQRPARDIAARVGIQLNPEFAEFALQGNTLTQRILPRLFRMAGNTDGEVLFRYALSDEGTGRFFQSEPVLNIAGLGTSSGERPFRHFSPPIQFAPRSVIGLEIIPVSAHVGRLFVSLQGYKVLGEAGTPTASSTRLRRRGRRA